MRQLGLAVWAALGLAACGGEVSSLRDSARDADAGPVSAGSDAGPVDASDAGEPVPDAGQVATGVPTDVSVGEVSLYQSVKVTLASSGQASARTNAPVVAGRAALVRVGVAPQSGFVPRELGCTLRLEVSPSDVRALTATLHATQASSDDAPDSFFTFEVPADAIAPSTRWSATLTDASAAPLAEGASSPARIPADGSSASLGARTDAGGLQLVLVPVQWNTDGSGRLPDTSDAQLARIRGLLLALYPMTELDLTVHAPLAYSGGLTWSGNVDFGDLNSQLQQLRQSDNAPDGAYYYALVEPADTFDDYCGGSCVTGQSYVVDDPSDAALRVGSGQGWSGDDSAWTLAHEVGHELGRYHAPCSAGSPDPNYPYGGGAIGVWGYDPRDGSFLSPTATDDFMGYCDNTWASDYTYSAIFDRLLAVHGAAPRALGTAQRYRFLAIDALGNARWRRPITLRKEPTGARVPAEWLDGDGQVLRALEVSQLALGDGDEVELALPEPPRDATAVRIGLRTFAIQ